MNKMVVKITESSSLKEVKDFYISRGEKDASDPKDRVFIAKDGSGKIVGAVRLCNDSGTFVLRTMEISPYMQKQGVGTRLLHAFKNALGIHECYCIAYAHLDSFYGKIGFIKIPFEEAPLFLQQRITEYRAENNGKEFILMKKPAR